jgi:predicted amidophosphoribosyltransferase
LDVGGIPVLLDKDHTQSAFDWFAERVDKETTFAKDTTYLVCPIPDSECTAKCGRPSKTLKLAQAITARIPRIGILDVLRFTKPMPKSSETNIRDEEALFKAMVCSVQKVPNAHILVLDDVCTTGAHARAAARRLMAHGANSVQGISVARTTQDVDDKLFGFRQDEI